MTTSSGLLLIDKPAGLTSHDVVARLRAVLDERRIGHAGTLDPMATGLLIIAVGASTRLLRFAQAETKRYVGTVQLGVATDSLDADGVVTQRRPVPDVTLEELIAVARSMIGRQSQIPPMVSALKVKGRRLHEMARAGIEVERSPREVVIDAFGISSNEESDRWDFDVTCSTGTYVRVLLSDLAERIGTVGHLTRLRRISSGRHDVANAHTLDEVVALADATSVLAAPLEMVSGLEMVTLDAERAAKMRLGQRVELDETFLSNEVAAVDSSGELVGVLTRRGDLWKPEIVVSGAGGSS